MTWRSKGGLAEMRRITVGMSSINTTVGAFRSNTDAIIASAYEMMDMGCHIGLFPEMTIPGYPTEDLVQWADFVDAQEDQLGRIVGMTMETDDLFLVVGLAHRHQNQIYNCLAVVGWGKVWGIIPKEELPTYGVFYEGRTFSEGRPGMIEYDEVLGNDVPFGDMIFDLPWGMFGTSICEEAWRDGGTISRRARQGAELILNASASPYRVGVNDVRRRMLRTRSADAECVLCYVNHIGGNDSLSFDGGVYVYQNGSLIHEGQRFIEHTCAVCVDLDQTARGRVENTTWRRDVAKSKDLCHTVEIPRSGWEPTEAPDDLVPESTIDRFIPARSEPVDEVGEIVDAITMGLDGYYRKTGAFDGVCIALSGGRDSMLTTLLVRDWTMRSPSIEGTPKIYDESIPIRCYSMPSVYNSRLTKGLSSSLCELLEVEFREVPIQDAFEAEMDVLREMAGTDDLSPLAIQNSQARIRAMRMWNLSNQTGALWIQCGNMSEKATGYTTIGGDLMGGYSLLGNVPKTIVNEMLRWFRDRYRETTGMGPEIAATIDLLLRSEASAELADDQEDERDLMPFEILDACYALFAGDKRSPQEVYDTISTIHNESSLRGLAPGYEPGMLRGWVERFVRLFFRNIYKWRQSPQAVHLLGLDFDSERALQIPTVTSLEWVDLEVKGDL
jgi:NAD+ synthase (glutamine-hydrolysing)